MTTKIFIDANGLLIDSFKLAKKIYQSGYKPDFFIGIWRGGTPPGIAIHEFFVYKGIQVKYHTAIKAESYSGIEKRGVVFIEGLNQLITRIKAKDKLLIIDDIFDTGKSIEAVKLALSQLIMLPFELKIATVYYKPEKKLTDFSPDFYLKSVNEWVVFPHELVGLSEEELKKKGEEIFTILSDNYE